MSAPSSVPASWALRVHAACDWVLWALALHWLWLAGTLAGGVVLGVAPASAAVATLTRRRLRGDGISVVREFAQAWRADFWRANAVVLPPIVVTGLLVLQALTPGPLPRAVAMVAAVAAGLLTTVVVPLFAHYDLPLRAHVPTASRWLLLNPAPAALLLVAAVAAYGAAMLAPGLVPLVLVGAWLCLTTALCTGFFHANDDLVAAPTSPPPSTRTTTPHEGVHP